MNATDSPRPRPFRRLAASAGVSLLLTASCSRIPSAGDAGPLPNGYLDLPRPGQTMTKGGQVTGWALGPSPVREVAIYVDGNYLQSATLGQLRPDVGKAFPQISGADHAGWSAALATDRITDGSHLLLVQVRTKSGASRDLGPVPITVRH